MPRAQAHALAGNPLALWAFGVVASTGCSGAHQRAPLSRRVRRCGRSGPRASHPARPQRREVRSRRASSADVLRSAAGSHNLSQGRGSEGVASTAAPTDQARFNPERRVHGILKVTTARHGSRTLGNQRDRKPPPQPTKTGDHHAGAHPQIDVLLYTPLSAGAAYPSRGGIFF